MPPLAAADVRLVGAFHVVVVLREGSRPGGTRSIDNDFAGEVFHSRVDEPLFGNRCSGELAVVSGKNAMMLIHSCGKTCGTHKIPAKAA
jgi:hypothetical protein